MEKNEDVYKVPSLEKGIAIIEYLSNCSKGDTLLNIKSELGIAQTTAYRILNILLRSRFLDYNEDTKCYRLSNKFFSLGFRALIEHNVLETVLPNLCSLRDKTHETACYGILGDKKGVLIEQVSGYHLFSFTMSPGKPFELHCSAPGKAIMAFLPKTVRDKYLSYMEFTRYNSRTITNPEAYLNELDKVYQEGYALDNEEEFRGCICISAPVLNYMGYPCGAIWISGPKDRLNNDKLKESIELVRSTAYDISYNLGFHRRR